MVILPAGSLRQRHKDGLDATARLEAEDSATIVDEVELSVSTTTNELPLLLLLSELIVLVLVDDGQVGGDDAVKAIGCEVEELLWLAIVQIVIEDTAKTTGLASVGDDEVVVSVLLELRVEGRVVLIHDRLVGSVEVLHILNIKIRRSDISSAAEPPDTTIGLEVSVVEVHGGAVGVAGMHDAGKTAGEEWDPFSGLHSFGAIDTSLGSSLECFLRHGTVYD